MGSFEANLTQLDLNRDTDANQDLISFENM